MAKENNFTVMLSTKISENKEMVISRNSNNEYVLATRAVINDNGKEKYYYDKGAIVIGNKYTGNFDDFVNKLHTIIW